MELKDFNALEEKLEEAREDDTPYLVANDNEMVVVGDANKTENKIHNFRVKYRFPQKFRSNFKDEDIIAEDKYEFVIEVEYNDVFISPRDNMKITAEVANLMPYFSGIAEDKSLRDLTDEEKAEIVASLKDEVVDSIYKVIQKVLKLSDEMTEHVLFSSAMEVMVAFIDYFPGDF